MDNQETYRKVADLRSKIRIGEEELEMKQREISSFRRELYKTEWIKISWNELEKWLKTNRPENNYDQNPMVNNDNNDISYCRLTKEGELQIGAYYHMDGYRRGNDLYVKFDFQSYRA